MARKLICPQEKKYLQDAPGGVIGGHAGTGKTLERVRRAFYWKNMRKEICRFCCRM